MSPEQCRAARAWLNWSQEELAAKANVSSSTLRDFEARRRIPIANNRAAIQGVLEEAGIEFLFMEGEPLGLCWRSTRAKKPNNVEVTKRRRVRAGQLSKS
ncbi:helix-turn-helix domain-containing protein [Bradyrhizobium genomosp. III]|uniref:helix-turn-helix domain-containing protein n=1 Tax=Bradyrhizobium genomosp. III TaxID=2683271 RepID=UPI0009D9F47F